MMIKCATQDELNPSIEVFGSFARERLQRFERTGFAPGGMPGGGRTEGLDPGSKM